MIFNKKKKQAEKPTSTTAQSAGPKGIQKMVYMGPTTYGNYRVVVFHNDGTHTHFYMDPKGNLYIPPKHTPEKLFDPKEAWKEWSWAKNNWTQNNTPMLMTDKKMQEKALKAMRQMFANQKTRQTIARKFVPAATTLGSVKGLEDARQRIQAAQ